MRGPLRWGGSPLGPPVASCLVLLRLPLGPSDTLGPSASPRPVEARGRDGSAWRLLVTWLFRRCLKGVDMLFSTNVSETDLPQYA
jgi:hypothetical protein